MLAAASFFVPGLTEGADLLYLVLVSTYFGLVCRGFRV